MLGAASRLTAGILVGLELPWEEYNSNKNMYLQGTHGISLVVHKMDELSVIILPCGEGGH